MPERELSAGPVAFAGLQLQKTFRVDRDGIGFDCGRCSNRSGNDFALREQALHAGVNQPRAKLREIEDTRNQRNQSREIEEDDAARET